jgi:dienelactone hydrolase
MQIPRLACLLLLPIALPAQGTAVPFGSGCPQNANTALGRAPDPGAGNLALYQLDTWPSAQPFACFGFSRTAWGPLPLPLDLSPSGLPGCSVLCEPLALAPVAVQAGNVAEKFLPVPADAALAGTRLYGQWFDLGDPRVAAPPAAAASNGVEFALGQAVGMPGFVLTGDPSSPGGAGWTYQATVAGVTYDLRGLLFRPPSPPPAGRLHPGVVINHGAGGNVNGYSSAIAHVMVGWGLVCIMTNLTHAGGVPIGSPGTAADFGASLANAQRIRKCVDLLQALGYVDVRRVAVHGHSMGAFATGAVTGLFPDAFLVASHTAGGLSDQPNAIATHTSQASHIRIAYQQHHGDADTTVPLVLDQQLEQVLQNNPTEHQLLVYPGYTHPQISNDPGMLATVRSWYAAHGLF